VLVARGYSSVFDGAVFYAKDNKFLAGLPENSFYIFAVFAHYHRPCCFFAGKSGWTEGRW